MQMTFLMVCAKSTIITCKILSVLLCVQLFQTSSDGINTILKKKPEMVFLIQPIGFVNVERKLQISKLSICPTRVNTSFRPDKNAKQRNSDKLIDIVIYQLPSSLVQFSHFTLRLIFFNNTPKIIFEQMFLKQSENNYRQ